MKPFNQDNPRFVWSLGAIAEEYPDMADVRGTVLYDRQEKQPVLLLYSPYGNLFCLETALLNDGPLTRVEEWVNGLSNTALASEGIPPTRAPSVFEQAGFSMRAHNVWAKPDPRGWEYGLYEASECLKYVVVRHNAEDFQMRFPSADSFLNWARACT